jgi:LacI family transcriptional regulator
MPVGITLKELAEKIGVSRTTVSRVMSGNANKYRISTATVEKVKRAAEQYGLVPNKVAQNLRLQRTDTIGLLIPDVANPFFANLASVIERELRDQGKMILLCSTNESTALETETLDMIARRQIDGLLVAPVGLEGGHFKSLEESPVVFIDRYFSDLTIPHVSTNNEWGAYLATKYLVDKGHSEIACIQGLISTVSNQDRITGIRKAISDLLGDQKVDVVGDGFTIQNGYYAMEKLLQSKNPPTAIFTLSNQIAIGALEAIRDSGKSVPQDFSLISFDEQPYFKLTSPPITAVRQPIEQIAQNAVRMLMDLIQGNEVSSLKIDPQVIERESVADINNQK